MVAFFISAASWNRLPFRWIFTSGIRDKYSAGARSGEHGGWLVSATSVLAKKRWNAVKGLAYKWDCGTGFAEIFLVLKSLQIINVSSPGWCAVYLPSTLESSDSIWPPFCEVLQLFPVFRAVDGCLHPGSFFGFEEFYFCSILLYVFPRVWKETRCSPDVHKG